MTAGSPSLLVVSIDRPGKTLPRHLQHQPAGPWNLDEPSGRDGGQQIAEAVGVEHLAHQPAVLPEGGWGEARQV